MISDGSELLLLIPSIAGIVGSCVLPILGAVPDGMIVLFSGMGPDAQNQLDVGVGALAGSTIMYETAYDPTDIYLSLYSLPLFLTAKNVRLNLKVDHLAVASECIRWSRGYRRWAAEVQ